MHAQVLVCVNDSDREERVQHAAGSHVNYNGKERLFEVLMVKVNC